MEKALVEFEAGPKELVEMAVGELLRKSPEFFSVDEPLRNGFMFSFSATGNLVFDDGAIRLRVSLSKYKSGDEITQEILLRDPSGNILYRLDINSGSKVEEEKGRISSVETGNEEVKKAISRMLHDSYGVSNGVTVSRYDNWAETEITTESALNFIKNGK